MPANIGDTAPDFTLPSVSDGDISLSQYRGEKNVVLSFHVFDFTSGWTTQATSFRQHYSRFEENNAQVLGISCDTVPAHRAWSTALGGLPYPELSDFHPKGKASQAYDLYNEERGAGNRAVIIVDKEGIIRFRETYEPGVLPDPATILAEVEKLG
jgi:peroxiredoxin